MVISLGVYSIFRHTHMVNNHGKTTNNGWFSQKNTSWERGWSGRHRGQLGQTRHQSRTLKCCFATKTRFWNMNLPEKMGLLIICFICFIELCFIICIYIYMFFYQTNSGLYHETYDFADLNPVHCAFPAATASTKLSRVSSDKTIAGSWLLSKSGSDGFDMYIYSSIDEWCYIQFRYFQYYE